VLGVGVVLRFLRVLGVDRVPGVGLVLRVVRVNGFAPRFSVRAVRGIHVVHWLFVVHGFLLGRRHNTVHGFVVARCLVVYSVVLNGGRLRRHGGRHLRLVTGCLERLRWDDVIAFGCQEFLPGTNFLARQLTSGVTEFLT
jgi:hypothetical protein